MEAAGARIVPNPFMCLCTSGFLEPLSPPASCVLALDIVATSMAPVLSPTTGLHTPPHFHAALLYQLHAAAAALDSLEVPSETRPLLWRHWAALVAVSPFALEDVSNEERPLGSVRLSDKVTVGADCQAVQEAARLMEQGELRTVELLFLALVLTLRTAPGCFAQAAPPLDSAELDSAARLMWRTLRPETNPSPSFSTSATRVPPPPTGVFQKFRRSEFQEITFVTNPVGAQPQKVDPNSLMGYFHIDKEPPRRSPLTTVTHPRGRRRVQLREDSAGSEETPPTSPRHYSPRHGSPRALPGLPRALPGRPVQGLGHSAPAVLSPGRLSLSDPRRSAFTEVVPRALSHSDKAAEATSDPMDVDE